MASLRAGGFEMTCRRRCVSVFVGIAALAALVLVVVPSASSGNGPDQYTASITPTSVIKSTTDTYTFTITNDSNSTDDLGSAQITLDSAYGSVTSATMVSPSTGWNATPAGNVVTLRATGSGLVDGAAMSVNIT